MRPPETRRPTRLSRGTEADSHNSVPRSPLQGGVPPLLPVDEPVRPMVRPSTTLPRAGLSRPRDPLPQLPAHLGRILVYGGDADITHIAAALTESLPVWGHA